jgi:hypothetical protein
MFVKIQLQKLYKQINGTLHGAGLTLFERISNNPDLVDITCATMVKLFGAQETYYIHD